MASSFPHSKYRKETSKQNSREDNHWSPSKPRSITLKRGGSSYQRNQHKPLSRQLMPGLVLSLSLSFFPSSKLPCYNLIRDELMLGGWEVLSRPDSAHSAFAFAFHFVVAILRLAPSNFSFAGHRTPGQSVSAPPPDARTPTPRPPRHTQCWKMTFPHPRGPPSLISLNPISKAWVFLIYWWSHTLTLSLQLCRTAHWQD